MDIIKITGPEVNSGNTANTFSNSHLLKVVLTAANTVVTRTNSANVVVGNTTLPATATIYWLAKAPGDTFTFSTAALVTPCAFQS